VGFRKGIPYLLEAFRSLHHPAKHLRIVGPVQNDIRPWLGSQDLDSVEILGRMPQSRLVEFMSTSHVMVLPSIEEGLALVQGQALACGCPLISSQNTGGSDLFSHGIEGFIVPIRSAQAIADGLQQLADDPALQRSMSEAALKRVKSLGGWKDYGLQYANFLRTLTTADKAAVPAG
jgi:glycosyltransferase involved in cell wall biosynthesis